jgi:hypothetical protein
MSREPFSASTRSELASEGTGGAKRTPASGMVPASFTAFLDAELS